MPLDGLTLGAVARELDEVLQNGRVDRVQQPESDELLLTIRAGGANHRLLLSASANHARVHITEQPRKSPDTPPMFCMLLRKHLGGARVTGVKQIGSDRILHIEFEALDELGDVAQRVLIAEIMGRHSNLILVGEGKILACARPVTSDVSRVRQVLPGLPYEEPPAQDKLNLYTATVEQLAQRINARPGALLRKVLQDSLSGLSIQAAEELSFCATGEDDANSLQMGPTETAERVLERLRKVTDPKETTVCRPNLICGPDRALLDVTSFLYLTRVTFEQRPCESMSQALDTFYAQRDSAERMKQRTASMRRSLQTALERCEKKLSIQLETQRDAQNMDEVRKQADLIMAAQHSIPKGADRALVPDYFDPEMAMVEIPLDPSLSAMDNAQRLYKQYAKRKAAARLVEGQIEENRAEIDYLAGQLQNIDNCSDAADLEEIRQELIREGYLRATSADRKKKIVSAASQPIHFVSADGIEVYIGKNNAQNDRLTQYADGNDTWLHAKDIPGSHVIVKHMDPPNRTLTQAARLAAHYSRARASGLVPVDITLRKYVKKPSGAKPGFVIYTHQRTVYVPPAATPEEALESIRNGE